MRTWLSGIRCGMCQDRYTWHAQEYGKQNDNGNKLLSRPHDVLLSFTDKNLVKKGIFWGHPRPRQEAAPPAPPFRGGFWGAPQSPTGRLRSLHPQNTYDDPMATTFDIAGVRGETDGRVCGLVTRADQ